MALYRDPPRPPGRPGEPPTWKVVQAHDTGMFSAESRDAELLEEMLNRSPGYVVVSITSQGQRNNMLVAVLLKIDSYEFRAMYGK